MGYGGQCHGYFIGTGRGVVVDPYVSWDIASVNYGGVGSFNEDDNGLMYDSEGLLMWPIHSNLRSHRHTKRHIIPILVTMTGSNGLDPDDDAVYTTESRFNFIVQRGRELPRVIDSDGGYKALLTLMALKTVW